MQRAHAPRKDSRGQQPSQQQDAAHHPASDDGSDYEIDLDALGMGSSLESTDLEQKTKPKVDVVESSDIDGPDDFTMNMTYWMTADLQSQPQIRSRKEASANILSARGNTAEETSSITGDVDQSDKAIIELSPHKPRPVQEDDQDIASRVSAENEERVHSYLDTLPNTEIGENALTSTPMRPFAQPMIHIPNDIPQQPRSLQATVEEYDTPRKSTQETVIHNMREQTAETTPEASEHDIITLQSMLEQQSLVSRTRITELETILSYTRTDLDVARRTVYQNMEQIDRLQAILNKTHEDADCAKKLSDDQVKMQEQELVAKLQDLGDEMRLQSRAQLDRQKGVYEEQMQALRAERDALHEQSTENNLRTEQQGTRLKDFERARQQETVPTSSGKTEHQQQLASIQAVADGLRSELDKARAEGLAAREEAKVQASLLAASQLEAGAHRAHVAELENRIAASSVQPVQTEGGAARRTGAADGTFEASSRMEALQAQIETFRTEAVSKDKQILVHLQEQEQQEQRINAASGRLESLEDIIATLRQQLAEAHREGAKARSDADELAKSAEEFDDRLADVRAETERRTTDVQTKLNDMKDSKMVVEKTLGELQEQHNELVETYATTIANIRESAEDAVRKAGALLDQERKEKKKVLKDFKQVSQQLDAIRPRGIRSADADDAAHEEGRSSPTLTDAEARDTEIENLRALLREQSLTMKSYKTDLAAIRTENKRLKADGSSADRIARLEADLDAARLNNEALETAAEAREDEIEATNKALDDRLAGALSQLLREKTRRAVGRRDGQWKESVAGVQEDQKLMGRMLLREWGRQEMGAARDGERQGYRYQIGR